MRVSLVSGGVGWGESVSTRVQSVSQSVSLVLSKLRMRYKGDHKCRRAPTKQAAENFSGSNLEPTELGAPFPRMFWGISRVGPVRLRARSVELRGHPCAKDCMRPTGKDRKIMKRDLGGLYAVGVFRLNKVGGFILGGHGDKKQFDVEY